MARLSIVRSRLQWPLLTGFALAVYPSNLVYAQIPSSNAFSIYCTSNLDGTGACNRIDNNQPIDCELIPGGVINCRQNNQQPIQCVIYSGVLDSQAYFYCTRRTDPGVSDNRINIQRFRSAPQNESVSEPNGPKPSTPLTNSVDRPILPGQGLSNPLIDVLN